MDKKILKLTLILILGFLLKIDYSEKLQDMNREDQDILSGNFKWITGPPILQAAPADGQDWLSIKDPSVIQFNGRWHLFCTVRGQKRSHAIVYLSFSEWNHANEAERYVLGCFDGYFCAPQVFYFSPHKKWYLICQASAENWNPKYQAAYSTTTDISDPDSWTTLHPLEARQADGKSGLDFWIIYDEKYAYLFFTTLDGRMWREQTPLNKFPSGWSKPVLAIQGDIFEAGHVYKLKGTKTFLALVEAQNGFGWRYFKAYLADSLDGKWRSLAAEKHKAFASKKNVTQIGNIWTDSISHGELIRFGYDEHLIVDTENLKFLFQGVTDQERQGKEYGKIPWRLGILNLIP
jgi:hypothetical protein